MKKDYKEASIELISINSDIVVASPSTSGPWWTTPEPTGW